MGTAGVKQVVTFNPHIQSPQQSSTTNSNASPEDTGEALQTQPGMGGRAEGVSQPSMAARRLKSGASPVMRASAIWM